MTPTVLMLFADGLGMPPSPATPTPLRADVCPCLLQMLTEHAVPADACLGVPGLPQSATGQTTLLTGVNAAAHIGRHVAGFPCRILRDLIRRRNIFMRIRAAGGTVTFANGYLHQTLEDVQSMRLQSVTTVAALSGMGDVRLQAHLLRGEAVAHDLTRASLMPRGYTGHGISPEQAAADLIAIAATRTFTLFEFFETDHAGHGRQPGQAEAVLRRYDRFLAEICRQTTGTGMLVLLTSDHGNIEDLSVHTHTRNPVPFAARGPGAAALRCRVNSIADITPAILDHLAGR